MGKVIPFRDNDVMKKYKKIGASIEDFCEKFYNDNFRILCLEMLKEIVAINSSLILQGNSSQWSSAIVYTVLGTNIKKETPYLSAEDLSIYFEVNPDNIYESKKKIEELLLLEKVKMNIVYDKANAENQLFLSSLGKELKEVLFDKDDTNNNYLEEEICLCIEEFYESDAFEKLNDQEKEYADIIIETFDFTMMNYLGEHFNSWTLSGVKKCFKDILPKTFQIGTEVFMSVTPVLKGFFKFLEEKAYIENGIDLAKLVDEI